MSARDPSRRAARTRERAGGVIAAVGVVLLAVLLLTGKAGLGFEGTADPDAYLRLTVTRACGSLAFLGVIMYLGYRPTRCTSGASLKETAAAVLPALAVAVNNAPLIPLLTGGARITADAGDVALYAVESLFIGTFEELAFRGVLLLTVVERFGKTRRGLFLSAVTTSAVFGASHLFNLLGGAGVGPTLLQVSYSFLIGAMCSLVLLLSGSLMSCVLIHAVYDFGGYLIPRLGEGAVWTAPEIALTAAVGVAAAVYYVCMCGRLDPARSAAMTTPAEPETPGAAANDTHLDEKM